MSGIGGWFRNFGRKLAAWFRHFMSGRYGTDRLNMAILIVGFLVALVNMFTPISMGKLLLSVVSYALVFLALFRSMSRNTYQRYQENRKFLLLFDRLKDRQHRYYDCPKCRQTVRVPRGKGKIAITCPKCREKFVKKT